jgi:hypothetical protein
MSSPQESQQISPEQVKPSLPARPQLMPSAIQQENPSSLQTHRFASSVGPHREERRTDRRRWRKERKAWLPM